VEIADDVLPRWITAAAVLDYHTVVGADKFENVFVCRLPESIDEDINEDFYTYKFKWEVGHLNGAACKFE
jgi:splicing factor 3B subunit 3